MKLSDILSASYALFAASATALNLVARGDAAPSVVSLNIKRKVVRDPIQRDAIRQRSTVSEGLDNEKALYYANTTIGNPTQNVRLHIDTGSSDMWVNTPSSQICTYRSNLCTSTGSYSPNKSSSYNYVNSQFIVKYVDGSGAKGDYVTDDVSIGGSTLKGLQFGIGYTSTTPESILGIGYTSNEGQVTRSGGSSYPNMPQAMANAGLIQTNAYSIWLDDLAASTGVILFGGVDKNKYIGNLKSLPIQQQNGRYGSFIVTLSGMSITQGSTVQNVSTSLPAPVILDTGSSITYLPSSLVSIIYQTFSVQYSRTEGIGYVSCSLAQQNVTLDFQFSGITIRVPMSELVINPENADDGEGDTYGPVDSLCLFGITSISSATAVLGDTFLRSAYVVFDLDNNEISLAQTNFNSTSTSIAEISKGSKGVPGASEVSNVVQATATQTGGGIIGTTATPTSRRNAAVKPVATSLGLVLIVALAAVFWLN